MVTALIHGEVENLFFREIVVRDTVGIGKKKVGASLEKTKNRKKGLLRGETI